MSRSNSGLHLRTQCLTSLVPPRLFLVVEWIVVVGQQRPAQQAEGAKYQPSVSCFGDWVMEDSIRSKDQSGLNLGGLPPCVFVMRLQEEVGRAPQ